MDESDLNKCLLPSGKWKCPIEICGQILSRKQTLKNHLMALHDVDGTWEVKGYKLYEFDPSLPVPRSTLAWKKRRLSQNPLSYCGVPSTNVDNSCLENLEPQQSDGDLPLEEVVHQTDTNTFEQINQDSDEENSDMEICMSDDLSNSRDEDNSSSDSESEKETVIRPSEGEDCAESGDAPLYVIPSQAGLFTSPITFKDHMLITCALMFRHNTSDTMFKHQLKYLGLHLPSTNIMEYNVDKLKKACGFEDRFMDFFTFCNVCKSVFPDNGCVCPTPNCIGKKQENSYFVTGNLKGQLTYILTRQGIWDSIQETATSTFTSTTISDITSGTEYKKLREDGNFLSNKHHISLSLFTDGIPLFKSSGASLWPVYLIINELPSNERFLRKNMILWGIWQGIGKPSMTTFLKPMVLDFKALREDGITVNIKGDNIVCKAMLVVATMDLQARAAVLHMTNHNGKFSCVFCMEPGEVVKSGKGHCRSFPYQLPLDLRSHNQIKTDAHTAQIEKKKVNGFTGDSVLNYLPEFKLNDNVVIDYMHGILLGITKKLLGYWFDSSSYDKPYFIGHRMKEIDVSLTKIKPPYIISRLPRKLSNTLHHWKASELRSWLLYYSIPCLKGKLPDVYLTHYSLLVEATAGLLGEGITQENLQRYDVLLHQFVKNAGTLYGPNFVGLNVHNLLHLVPCVKKWGPLWAWSCFCFESFNGEIKKSVHGTGNVCKQIFWCLQAQKEIEKKASEPGESAVKDFLREMTESRHHNDSGTQAYQCVVKGLSHAPVKLPRPIKMKVLEAAHTQAIDEFLKASKIVRNGFVMYSKACQKVQRRNSFSVLTSTNSVVEVEFYLVHKDTKHVYAVCKKLDTSSTVMERRVLHIRQGKYEGSADDLHVIKAEDLQQLVVNFQVDGQKYIVYIPNTIERD